MNEHGNKADPGMPRQPENITDWYLSIIYSVSTLFTKIVINHSDIFLAMVRQSGGERAGAMCSILIFELLSNPL